MNFLDLSVEAQTKIAELEGMSIEEYIKQLEYLANETIEEFDVRLKDIKKPKGWTEADTKLFVNKMSFNPQKMD